MNPKQYLENPRTHQKNLDNDSTKKINMPLRGIKETQKTSRNKKSNICNVLYDYAFGGHSFS